jgi:DNA-binding winged helix-turn-helix (wHTH) protein
LNISRWTVLPLLSRLLRGLSRTGRPGDPTAVRCFETFEFDPIRRELLKEGLKLDLPYQAAVLLELLTRTPQALVSREAIRKAFWPDFPPAHPDAGSNNAVLKLRRLLSDSLESPRFVQSVPGEGYLFRASVSPRQAAAAERLAESGLAIATGVAFGAGLFTQAAGVAAIGFGVFFLLLVVSYDQLQDTRFMRGLCALVLFLGMAYVPSAWTMNQLSGEVIGFESVSPAVAYPFVTGMKFLPLFSLVLVCWTLTASQGGRLEWLPGSPPAFWTTAVLLLGVTGAALSAYSGDVRVWRTGVPGWTVLALGYLAVSLVNVGFAWTGRAVLRGRLSGGSRRLLALCAVAYLAILVPALAIEDEYNSINRHYLSTRRVDVYRARNPDAVLAFLQEPAAHAETGPDLLHLLRDPEFRHALAHEPFYRVDFDEPFQVWRRAVTFGYRRPQGETRQTFFRLVRFPEELARAIGFELVEDR